MTLQDIFAMTNEGLDGLPPQTDYIQLPSQKKKKKSKRAPTDKAQQDLINYIWFNQNADAT